MLLKLPDIAAEESLSACGCPGRDDEALEIIKYIDTSIVENYLGFQCAALNCVNTYCLTVSLSKVSGGFLSLNHVYYPDFNTMLTCPENYMNSITMVMVPITMMTILTKPTMITIPSP